MGRSVTVGVVTVATGPYKRFLPDWISSVNGLDAQPDLVVIVTDDLGIGYANADTILVRAEGTYQHHPQVFVNQGIALMDTDYIVKLDVDDMFLPYALDGLEHHGTDIIGLGIRLGHVDIPSRITTADEVLTSRENLLFSGSAFTRRIWEQNPFRDMIYEDWAFWIESAKHGATFSATGRADYEYRLHGDNISLTADDTYWRKAVDDLR